MALTLDGFNHWPSRKTLQRLGETRMGGSPATVGRILERVSEALTDTIPEVKTYIDQHAEFAEIGSRMIQEREKGRQHSLLAA